MFPGEEDMVDQYGQESIDSSKQQYWDIDLSSYPNLNNNHNHHVGFDIAHQLHHASHRASEPMAFMRMGLSVDDGLDLSRFDAMAQNSADKVGLEDVIKPEHNIPWSSAHHRGGHSIQPSTIHSHTRSEPAMKQDRTSDAADSGYYSHLNSLGMQPLDQYNTNRPELEHDYSSFQPITSDDTTADRKNVPSVTQNSRPAKERRVRRPLAKCSSCGRDPKNQSDSNKHELTHTRPYRCTEPGCNRKDGFATENDLQRHRKSVHNLLPTVGSVAGYVCAACPPERNHLSKFWPRKDNFKAHILRKHPKHDLATLTDASRQSMRPDDTRTVDTDMQSVRSALRSAHQSQVDPSESHAYQSMGQMDIVESLSRQASTHGEFAGLFATDSTCVLNAEEALVGMQGHTADLVLPQNHYSNLFLSDDDVNGLSILSAAAANNLNYDNNNANTSFMSSPSTRQSFSTFTGQPSQPPKFSSQPPVSSIPTTGIHACPHTNCNTTWPRACDLTKHLKRHTKPYGCTFPHCFQKSGSRGDWKRHENSNHYMSPMWRCGRMKVDGSVCARRPFQREDSLRAHLKSAEHGIVDTTELNHAVADGKLGEEGKGQFWCGFCCQVVVQKNEDGEEGAWQARLKHVGDHFDKEGLSIDDWVCVEENRKKKYCVERVEAPPSRQRQRHRKDDADNALEGELPEWCP